MFPKSGAPMETDADFQNLTQHTCGVPSKGTLPPGPRHGVPSQRDVPLLEPSFIHLSQSPVHELPSKGPLWREMSVTGVFLDISSRVPSK
jgi:hypothetical protein